MKVAMTGVSGNMGREAFAQAMELPDLTAKILLTNKKANDKLAKKIKKRYGDQIGRASCRERV